MGASERVSFPGSESRRLRRHVFVGGDYKGFDRKSVVCCLID